MTETKFTPAPWIATELDYCNTGKSSGRFMITDGNMVTVCDINNIPKKFDHNHPNYKTAIQEQLANAALIAAAPEMYQELEETLNLFEELTQSGDPRFSGEISAIETLLAKARGE